MTKIKNNSITIVLIIISLILLFVWIVFLNNSNKVEDDGKFNIVTTFYPMELIIKNISKDAKNLQIDNITKEIGGCVHEYSLTPDDAKIIEKADVLVINGGDMEHFIQNINLKKLNIIDSSLDIKDLDTSSHFWMNIDLYIKQVENISNGLIKYNPENKEIYEKNAQEYIKKLNELKEIYNDIPSSDVNVAIMHDSFNYYKGKFNITASLITGHEGNHSANDLQDFVNKIKSTQTKILLVDNDTFNNNQSLIDTIVNDTKIEVFQLNLIVENTEDLNNYLDLMEYNYEIIEGMINYGKAY
ncbi:MAG: zinc ABC transporter substrate-binding protein [Clostridiales bacterium]|nr:zinc ABC transporter substrate-binding protein [Clostridiales bacterium]